MRLYSDFQSFCRSLTHSNEYIFESFCSNTLVSKRLLADFMILARSSERIDLFSSAFLFQFNGKLHIFLFVAKRFMV